MIQRWQPKGAASQSALVLLLVLIAGVGIITLSDRYGRDVRALNNRIADLYAQAIDAETRAVEHEAKAKGLEASLMRALQQADAAEQARLEAEKRREVVVIRERVEAMTQTQLTESLSAHIGVTGGISQTTESVVMTLPAARRNLEYLIDREILTQSYQYAVIELGDLRAALIAGAGVIAEERAAKEALRQALSLERSASHEEAKLLRRRAVKYLIGGVGLGFVIGFAAGR